MPAERRGAGRWRRDVHHNGRPTDRNARMGYLHRRAPRPRDVARTADANKATVDGSPQESQRGDPRPLGSPRCQPQAAELARRPWYGPSILFEVITTDWKAVCGRSASTLWREGGPTSIGPPYPDPNCLVLATRAIYGIS